MGRFRTQAIGLDIDRGSLKAVQVSGGAGGYVLQHVGYHRLPPGVIVDGEVADHDLLAAEIKEFWNSHSFKGKSVIVGVSNQKVVVRLLDFPRMPDADLKSAIGFEAQDHIPMPLDEAIMDYVVLGPVAEGSDLDRILIVAAQRDMISRYSSAVKAAGLRPTGVDVKALALTRSIVPEGGYDETGAVMILDIGSELTNLVVYQGGSPALTQFLPGGSLFFIQNIADAADIPDEEAEKQLMNPRVRLGSALDSEDYREIEDSTTPLYDDAPENTLDTGNYNDDTVELGDRGLTERNDTTSSNTEPETDAEPETSQASEPREAQARDERGSEEEPQTFSNGGSDGEQAEEQFTDEEPATDAEEVEEAGDEASQGDWDPALDYDVRRGLEESIGILAEDVQRSIDYYYSQPEARELSQVFVTGEGALVATIDAYLSELLGVHTVRGTPLDRVVNNRSNVSDEQLKIMEPVLAVAFGLAMDEP